MVMQILKMYFMALILKINKIFKKLMKIIEYIYMNEFIEEYN